MDAWLRVKHKKAAGGIDLVTVEEFGKDLSKNLEQLRRSLQNKTYTPEPLDRIHAPKVNGSGETRPLSLPTIKDKIIQQAVRSVIEPLFNPIFLNCSYAYRTGKGPQKAFKRVNHYLAAERRYWAALGDFDRFFDTLDQDYLLRQVRNIINDPDIIRLIRMWLRSGFVNRKGDYFDRDTGLGQGSVISPLLSNIYVHPLDEYMTQKGYAYIRYSDNIIILCYTRREACQALEDLKSFIHDVQKLQLNENAHAIQSLEQGFVFLGIYYKNDKRCVSRGKMAHIKNKIKAITWGGKSPDTLIEKLNKSLDGTSRYYSVLHPESQFIEIDEYLAQRLTPLLGEYLRKNMYRSVDDLVAYLSSLSFLSDFYKQERDQRLRTLAGLALKNTMIKKEQEEAGQTSEGIKKAIKEADHAVSRRKRRYFTTQTSISEIVVNTHGSFLGKQGNRLVVKLHKKNLLTQHLDKIKNISVATKGVTLSSELIHECTSRKIPIYFVEKYGPPYAIIYTPLYPQATLSLLQLQARQNGQGLQIATRIVAGKIRNQLNLIKFYGRSRKEDRSFQEALNTMESEIDTLIEETEHFPDALDYDVARDRLFSVEGRGASIYWHIVRKLLEDEVDFPGRKRKGADDLINSLLNYGYGILYSRIWLSVILAGLNPFIGFLHAPQKDKPTLVFDLIEEFRCQAVDRAVFTMASRGEALALDRKSGLLTEMTRRKLIENVFERIYGLVPYQGKKVKLDDVMRFQPRRLAKCLENGKSYRPYIGRY